MRCRLWRLLMVGLSAVCASRPCRRCSAKAGSLFVAYPSSHWKFNELYLKPGASAASAYTRGFTALVGLANGFQALLNRALAKSYPGEISRGAVSTASQRLGGVLHTTFVLAPRAQTQLQTMPKSFIRAVHIPKPKGCRKLEVNSIKKIIFTLFSLLPSHVPSLL